MKRTLVVLGVAVVMVCFACFPVYGAGFAPLFPKHGAPVVAPPNFAWSSGGYDLFVLYLLLPIPISGFWYEPIPVPFYQQTYLQLPQTLWDYVQTDGNFIDVTSNEVYDLSPMVQNAGIGLHDNVWLEDNPLSEDSCNVYVPELEGRGAWVYHDCP